MKKKLITLSLICISFVGCTNWFSKSTKQTKQDITDKRVISNVTVIENEDMLNNIIKDNNSVVVKFGADWCGACKQMAPTYSEASHILKNIKFVTVNIDKLGSLANKYGISGIPTLIFFKDGKQLEDKIVGNLSKDALIEKIKKNL